MSKAAISLIQTGLRDLGYQPGPVDGLYGAKTRTATEGWLKAGGAALSVMLPPSLSGMIFQGKARYPVSEIVVHCSATRPDWMLAASFADQVAEIRRWHIQDRGWRDIGYHWLISRSGDLLPGRAETEIGAGVIDHNRGVIHVCLIGGAGSAETDRFRDNFTAAQDATLRGQLQAIGMRTQIRRISGHNEWAAKACPGFNVPAWLKEAA
jgi:peptidoglycan hydrolase-like protein with peptidoglycan-binding domain